ncbi:hypothetical protein F0562_035776 [Nyssa sinensis]|uniref:Uncharacterized protein n=1 Tax=Nyssa sinensis TaxID=561372 RepID=A0A5J5AH00_9ASTE|nr:hypothetical protein F0562_035776 [Nyssa sinensis]
MLKQSPSRNQRSKGFKVKHPLQICLLLAIAIWLLYQVKHSHDKKVALESSGQSSEKVQHGHEISKLGRKDLNPRTKEAAAENLKHGDEEEELEQEDEDEESKSEENEDEGRGVGDDEIDGQDQEKAEEEEPEQLEDLIDEEDKDSEEGSEGKENLEKEDRIDDGVFSNTQDHGGVERNSEKAQEEHYKGDDAASAVVQNTQIVNSESENGLLRAVKEEERVKNVAENNTYGMEEVNDSNLEVGDGGEAGKIRSVNSVSSEEKVSEFSLNNLDDGVHYNSSMKAELNEQEEVNNNSTAAHVQMVVLDQNRNLTETTKDEQSHFSASLPLTGNSDAARRELEDSSVESETAIKERVVVLDAAPGRAQSSATTENADADAHVVHSGDSNANASTEEAEETTELPTTNVTTAENVQNYLIDSSDSLLYQEDKEDHISLEAALLETNVGEGNGGNASNE